MKEIVRKICVRYVLCNYGTVTEMTALNEINYIRSYSNQNSIAIVSFYSKVFTFDFSGSNSGFHLETTCCMYTILIK